MAALFLFLFSLILTLSPAVRLHRWDVPYRWNHWIGYAVWLVVFIILHRQVVKRLSESDPFFLPVAALLTGWGLLTIWRLDSEFGLRQTAWLAIAMVLLVLGLRAGHPLYFFKRYKYLWLIGGLALTVLTFFFGTYPGGVGPRLWLGCCGVYLQPSEPLKLLLIIYLSAYLADSMPVSFNFWQLIAPTFVLVGSAMAILLAQRDLGTATIFLLLYFFITYLATGKRNFFIAGGFVILASAISGYLLFDVIRLRVDSWLNPWVDPSGRSYQVVQSIIAVASGGLLGTGPGMGSPSIVPVAHSDFIFAAIAEETGLLGSVAVLGLLALILGRGLKAAVRAPNLYQRYLAAGLSVYLAMQAMLIIGGNIRVLPLTGVTLPFVSYGGSSLLTAFLALLLLLLISSQPETEPTPLPNQTPYLAAGSALLTALMVIALINGWWATIRSADLINRPDNPRWSITDRYSPRGALLDRNNQPILVTQGRSGELERELLHIPLGTVVGYTHPLYGQAGLEAGLDSYLRGIRGLPELQIWVHQVLYAQRPPGLDIRLSLDLTLQQLADELLGQRTGSIVLLNAASGEILVMASHPYINPNEIETGWENWIKDPQSPLVNRAVQGQYPQGLSIGPFLLAWNNTSRTLPALPTTSEAFYLDQTWDCALPVAQDADWSEMIKSGCPAAAITLGRTMGEEQISELYKALGYDQAPELPALGVTASTQRLPTLDVDSASLGQSVISVSPLQVALASASISNNGLIPSPLIASAVNTPEQGWIALASGTATQALPQTNLTSSAQMLNDSSLPVWTSVANARSSQNTITWFIGGTTPDWKGTPLALAIVLEENNPQLAQQIGMALLQAATSP